MSCVGDYDIRPSIDEKIDQKQHTNIYTLMEFAKMLFITILNCDYNLINSYQFQTVFILFISLMVSKYGHIVHTLASIPTL